MTTTAGTGGRAAPAWEAEMAERVTPLEMSPEEFRRLGHDLVERIAEFLGGLRDRPLTTGETPGRDPAPARPGADARRGGGPGGAAPERRPAAVRSLAVQRPPAVHGVHHLVRRAARGARRPARRERESQRGRVGAVAGRVGDRGADGALGGRAGRLSGRRRRPAGERRQHGQLRLLPRGAARDAGRGGEDGRARPGRPAAPGVHLGGHPHLDPEGVRPVRPGHRRDPMDSDRRRSSACGWTRSASAAPRGPGPRATGRSWSSVRRAA